MLARGAPTAEAGGRPQRRPGDDPLDTQAAYVRSRGGRFIRINRERSTAEGAGTGAQASRRVTSPPRPVMASSTEPRRRRGGVGWVPSGPRRPQSGYYRDIHAAAALCSPRQIRASRTHFDGGPAPRSPGRCLGRLGYRRPAAAERRALTRGRAGDRRSPPVTDSDKDSEKDSDKDSDVKVCVIGAVTRMT